MANDDPAPRRGETTTPINALRQRVNGRAGETAFIFGGEAWSYRRLAGEVERLARALRARGLRPGDRVALHMANLPELAVAYYACFRLGAIAAPLNTRFKTAELRSLLQRLQPALYLGQAQLYPQVAPVEPAILPADARFVVGGLAGDERALPWASLLAGADGASAPPDPDRDAPAVLLTTSGTTGLPKFVTHTPATMAAKYPQRQHLGLTGDDVVLVATPMVHGSGLTMLVACIRFDIPMVMLERFDPDAALDAVEAQRCSWMLGLPFMFAEMAKRQRARPRRIGSLRCCLVGGDACPTSLEQDFLKVFGVPLRNFWGSTEAGGSLLPGLQPGPSCRIAPGVQVRLVDDEGGSVPRGAVGELQVRGPHLAVGYWAAPGRIEDPRSDGWFATGDLMRQGEEDELWFVARKKDLIIRGGSNISPLEVERVLLSDPAVREAVVVGLPDAELGQRVAALLQLAGGPRRAACDDILARSREQLADYKLPERLEVVDAIPRNALGKVDRRAALAILLSGSISGSRG